MSKQTIILAERLLRLVVNSFIDGDNVKDDFTFHNVKEENIQVLLSLNTGKENKPLVISDYLKNATVRMREKIQTNGDVFHFIRLMTKEGADVNVFVGEKNNNFSVEDELTTYGENGKYGTQRCLELIFRKVKN